MLRLWHVGGSKCAPRHRCSSKYALRHRCSFKCARRHRCSSNCKLMHRWSRRRPSVKPRWRGCDCRGRHRWRRRHRHVARRVCQMRPAAMPIWLLAPISPCQLSSPLLGCPLHEPPRQRPAVCNDLASHEFRDTAQPACAMLRYKFSDKPPHADLFKLFRVAHSLK